MSDTKKIIKQFFSPDEMDAQGGDLIPLLSSEEEEELNAETLPEELSILTVRNTVLFPGVVIPVTVGRKKSIALVKEAYKNGDLIGVVAQENPQVEDPTFEDLFKVGTAAKILRMLVLPDGNTTIIIQGKRRFQLEDVVYEQPYLRSKIIALEETFDEIEKKETDAFLRGLKDEAKKILKLSPELPQEAQFAIDNIETPGFLTHFIASNIGSDVSIKQTILEENDARKRILRLLELLDKELQVLTLKSEIHSKTSTDIDAQQRDYYLRQQMKVLQTELGDDSPEKDLEGFKEKAKDKKWPVKVKEHYEKELSKLNRMHSQSPEYSVSLNYVETLVDLPWGQYSKDNFSLKRAQKILDKEHYGLKKVKERILEYLAVIKLKADKSGDKNPSMKGPILCLYGPPGVGKTSLGKSIAKALGREYIRMSLGGVHDESEIRGHRKTYIGAMPGKILQNINKAKTSNPVFVLDEIDKLGTDHRGDPSSALLEVLDPEQNSTFTDNYVEVEYDLSKVLFLSTSNSLDTIQPALRDRMEIIELTGYTIEEKIEIAKRHLIPRQIEEHGFDKNEIKFSKEAVRTIVEGYTSESGVRGLERQVGAVIRSIAKDVAFGKDLPSALTSEDVVKILGAEFFEKESYEELDKAGIVTGLAWTSVGGVILTIESILSKGKGKITLSGQLGDVMKESAMAALSNLKANASRYGVDHRLFDAFDLHIHFPAGAVPKDGPSAGITIYTSLASLFTQRRVKAKLAMTGELTLSGKVLPVGGIKEKILAAKRAGISEIIMCKKNKKDVDDIEPEYIKGLKINYVTQVEEVIEIALLDEKVNNPVDLSIEKKKKDKTKKV
jgi:ATP-dependent Lon protease